MIIAQFGESANTLIKQWKGGYRYGFPTLRAAEPPVRPMYYDQSQIYSGVIGRQYQDSANRYMYAYDPNMYLQPGFGGAAENAAITALERFLTFAPTGFDDFDVVFDTSDTTGVGVDGTNRLFIIHGATLRAIKDATATAGGVFVTNTPDAGLAKRIAAARAGADPTIVNATIGKVDDVRFAAQNLIEALKTGTTTPRVAVPVAVTTSKGLSRNTKIVIGVGAAVVALGAVSALLLRRRSEPVPTAPGPWHPAYAPY